MNRLTTPRPSPDVWSTGEFAVWAGISMRQADRAAVDIGMPGRTGHPRWWTADDCVAGLVSATLRTLGAGEHQRAAAVHLVRSHPADEGWRQLVVPRCGAITLSTPPSTLPRQIDGWLVAVPARPTIVVAAAVAAPAGRVAPPPGVPGAASRVATPGTTASTGVATR